MPKLRLAKETLTQLSADELAGVAGAAITPNCPNNTLTCAGGCNSDFQQCITGVGCLSVTGC